MFDKRPDLVHSYHKKGRQNGGPKVKKARSFSRKDRSHTKAKNGLQLHDSRLSLTSAPQERRISSTWMRRTVESPPPAKRTMIAIAPVLPGVAKPVCAFRACRRWGIERVKKRSIALALGCSLVCSPVCATTFIGVLWPLFGPLAAPGLVEFVAELQSMPDVEVVTYLHPSWSSLVDDINRQSEGTHILVIGYSLGANNAVLVANNTNYIDSIIALQPSIFTPNTSLIGNVGRIVEIYNPNPWMTFGGMGSQRLVGLNIEYITNNDSHLGAPFNSEFRNLVKSEIARLSAEPAPDTAQAKMPKASHPTQPAKALETPKLEVVKEERLQHQLEARTAHVDALQSVVNSRNSAVQR